MIKSSFKLLLSELKSSRLPPANSITSLIYHNFSENLQQPKPLLKAPLPKAKKASNSIEKASKIQAQQVQELSQDQIEIIVKQVSEPSAQFLSTQSTNLPENHNPLILKLTKHIPTYTSDSLVTLTMSICDSDYLMKSDLLWNTLQTEYKNRMKVMDLKQIAEVLWCFAYANRHDPKFFTEIEEAIFDCDLEEELDYKLISKILWGFSHANHGTPILYSSIAKHIKRIYFEVHPIKLAEYAYYFSKASNSMKGGYGTFQVAEEEIRKRLKTFDLMEVRKICEYLLPQNIGSNEFFTELEDRVLELYPQQIEPPTLVAFVKAMSRFRFKTELFSKLQKNVMEYMEHMSNSQIEEILWGFTRGRRGSDEFYEKIEKEFLKRMNTLKPRGVAFSFYEFSLVNRGSSELLMKYQEYISKNLDKFNIHYLMKILTALRKRSYDSFCQEIMVNVLDRVSKVEAKFKLNDIMKLLDSISGYISIQKQTDLTQVYEKVEKILLYNNPKPLEISQACTILYHFVANNQGSAGFISHLKAVIQDINLIPKNSFCQSFYSYVEMCNDEAFDFMEIVEELSKYGQIKYFFDHENFIRMIWSIASLLNEDPSIMRGLSKLSQQDIKEAMFDINPNTLTPDINKLYYQIWPLMRKFVEFEDLDEKKMYDKVSEINAALKEEIHDSIFIAGNPAVRDEVYEAVKEFAASAEEGYELVRKMYDEFFHSIDVGMIDPVNKKKIAVLIQTPRHFLKYREVPTIGQYAVNKERCMKNLGWRIVEISEDEWVKRDIKENKELVKKKLEVAVKSTEITVIKV